MLKIFPYIENVIIPTDELIFFRGVGPTTNQVYSIAILGVLPSKDDYEKVGLVHAKEGSNGTPIQGTADMFCDAKDRLVSLNVDFQR